MKKVLLVDDDEVWLNFLKDTFIDLGWEAIVKKDGSEVHQELKTTLFDLLVIDFMLPEKDGIEILKEVRRDFDSKKLPVVIVSSKEQDYDKELASWSGANDYLVKPTTPDEIKKMLERLKQTS